MSTLIMSQCWPLQMSPKEKAVLISLADNANDCGFCYPSIRYISTRTCYSKDTVIRAIKLLEKSKIVTANRENGRHTSYTITPESFCQAEKKCKKETGHRSQPATGSNLSPVATCVKPVATCVKPVATCVKPVAGCDTNHQEPPKTVKNRQREEDAASIPDWLPAPIWNAYVEHRSFIKKPLSEHAKTLSIEKLDRWRKQGHDPRTIINDTIANGWQGLFEPKPESAKTKPQKPSPENFSSLDYGTGGAL